MTKADMSLFHEALERSRLARERRAAELRATPCPPSPLPAPRRVRLKASNRVAIWVLGGVHLAGRDKP